MDEAARNRLEASDGFINVSVNDVDNGSKSKPTKSPYGEKSESLDRQINKLQEESLVISPNSAPNAPSVLTGSGSRLADAESKKVLKEETPAERESMGRAPTFSTLKSGDDNKNLSQPVRATPVKEVVVTQNKSAHTNPTTAVVSEKPVVVGREEAKTAKNPDVPFPKLDNDVEGPSKPKVQVRTDANAADLPKVNKPPHQNNGLNAHLAIVGVLAVAAVSGFLIFKAFRKSI